ncbi:fumarylacetoacetate hydrolase family protein [Cryobacterium sp. BB736]|uniref:fumarylacetoacetate hydrolase family protein n=1 Tax=Cryobacterium sp. BB736 TaxID=2746963 RepID=UPI001873A7F6|nr:fumarylacetoacetate hydrolase family protein [Cryobacterium sp. BB736]
MKLVSFRLTEADRAEIAFGAVRGAEVVRFTSAAGHDVRGLDSMDSYLAGLPDTFDRAAAIVADPAQPALRLNDVQLLAPLPQPAALLDCGLSPKHLRASTRTLLRRSLPFGVGRPVGALLGRAAARSKTLRFYKGNHYSISGTGDTIDWPDFTAYLDIEPELAIVTGAEPQQHSAWVEPAGYLIYNDASARDVQLGEMLFTGPASSKDFDTGNGIGPYLVTPDEVPNPLDLAVTVTFDGRSAWTGTTSDYSLHPARMLAHILRRRSLPAGTVVGMGTIPGCCGLDRDEWLEPGEAFTINIDGLGSLAQRFGTPATMPTTGWGRRAPKDT